jgi:hypothetical protein
MMFMRPTLALVLAVATFAASAAVARADTYPVSGRFGISNWTVKGAIDCANLRVINFAGEQRTDSDGGVPGYRNNWVRREGEGRYRVADWFSNGQVRNGQVFYELLVLDADRLEMILDRGGTLKMQRCQ